MSKKKVTTQEAVLKLLRKKGSRLRIAKRGKLPPIIVHPQIPIGQYPQVSEKTLCRLREKGKIKYHCTVELGDYRYIEYTLTTATNSKKKRNGRHGK